MDWPLSFLIVSLVVTLLGFLWGIIKVFKKSNNNNTLDDLKDRISIDNRECQSTINTRFTNIENRLNKHGNLIHDLQKDRDILNKNFVELKDEINKVSIKCDAILDKVIEYMSKD